MPIDKKTKQSMELELDETSLNVLISFFPKVKDVTIKEIQKNSEYSYEPVYRTLTQLVERKLITFNKVGKTLVYSLNLNHFYSKLAHYHYSNLRAMKFLQKHPKIKIALDQLPQDKLDVVIIFGSYSRDIQRKDSDIDLIVVTPYEKEVDSSLKHVKSMYGLDFQPIIMSREEFAKIQKENKELWESLITYGIIIKGSDLFYYHAYQNGK